MPITHGIRRPTNGMRSRSTTRRAVTTGNPAVLFTRIAARLHERRVQCAGVGNAAPSGLPVDIADVSLQRLVLSMDDCRDGRHHVCLRKVEAQAIFDAIREHKVTHYCGAPIVHSLLISAPDEMKRASHTKVHAMVAAAAPPASMIEGMDRMGFDLTHVYGLTEVYGPAPCAQSSRSGPSSMSASAR